MSGKGVHLGRFEFLLIAMESADPAPPEVDGAVFGFISEKLLFSTLKYFDLKTSQKPRNEKKKGSIDNNRWR